MKALIIEDSDYKVEGLSDLISELDMFSEFRIAKSFQSGVRELDLFRPDTVLLDMTLPTSEKTGGQTDGRNRLYGGREILAEMEFLDVRANVIIVTQFDHFGEPPDVIDLNTLINRLMIRFPFVVGGVYYSNLNSLWRDELRSLLLEIRGDL
jgi:DNA-binding NarL/FixJ family response regulator